MDTDEGAAWHELVPAAAGVRIDAWAPHRAACLEEGGRALVESFVDIGDLRPTDSVTVTLSSTLDDEMLVELFEEVMFELDAHANVPVEIMLEDTEDGGVAGVVDTAPLATARVVGKAPKRVSQARVERSAEGDVWHCQAFIDW